MAAALGGLLYVSSRHELESYLQSVRFAAIAAAKPDPLRGDISMIEVGWFVLFLALSVGAVLLVVAGVFSGAKARWGLLLLGAILVADLFRANAPWIIYYDYAEKYASNPVLDLLRDQPQEHRVAVRLSHFRGLSRQCAGDGSLRGHGRPGVASTPISLLPHPVAGYRANAAHPRPRSGIDEGAFAHRDQCSLPIARLWQLTNTKYILGMKGFADLLNQQLDPAHQSFKVKTTFEFAPKREDAGTRAEDITAVTRPDGAFAVFEFGAALPRAKLFDRWEVVTDDRIALARLADPSFDPQQLLLVSDQVQPPTKVAAASPTNAPVTITGYKPKHVFLQADAAAPSILLLNDKWDPNWRVLVDGKPAPLLRCNYIMRGVALSPGHHSVAFHFDPPHGTLWVTLAGMVVGLGLCVLLAVNPTPIKVNSEPKPVELTARRK